MQKLSKIYDSIADGVTITARLEGEEITSLVFEIQRDISNMSEGEIGYIVEYGIDLTTAIFGLEGETDYFIDGNTLIFSATFGLEEMMNAMGAVDDDLTLAAFVTGMEADGAFCN